MASKRTTRTAVWLVLTIVLLAASITGGYYIGLRSSKPQEQQQEGLPETIKVGVMLPLSGELGPIGIKMLNGAILAAKVANNTGGIGGRPIKIVAEDTLALPDRAIEAAKKLVEVEGVKVIVGPATSAEVLAMAKYVNDRQVVIISTSGTAAKISELGNDYVFRVVPSDVLQTAAIADLIKAKGYKRVVTFVVANDYGIGLEEGLKKIVRDMVVGSIRYDPQKGDFRSELEQAKAWNPDAVFYALWVESGKIVFKQAMDLGLDNIPSLGGEGMHDVSFFADAKAAEYMAKTTLTGTKPTSPRGTYGYEHFYQLYRATFKEEPPLFGDYTYDATMLAIQAVAQAGGL